MKRLIKSTKKNKGFSLVEVLVAMTVIALISIPLIRTFVMSSNVNRDARRLQNATDIAQNVSEYFKVIPLFDLKQSYRDDGSIRSAVLFDDADVTSSGAYVFQNVGNGNLDKDGVPYYEGADGEDFYVTVVLNPALYSDGSLSGVKDINNYISPEVGDLFNVDIITAYSQFTKYDNKIKKTFHRNYSTTQVPESLDYSDIKKTVNVYVEQSQNATNPNKTDYTYSMTVRYTYCTKSGNDYVESEFYLEYNFLLAQGVVDATGTAPDLYLLYTPYDVNDSTHSNSFARDEMYINYRKGEMKADWEEPVDIYIVQQDGGADTLGLDIDKVYLSAYMDPTMKAAEKAPAVSNLDLYANISGWDTNMKVTAGNTNMVKLYTMDVYVWYGKKDTNDIDAYIDANFESDSHFTVVTTIKEE